MTTEMSSAEARQLERSIAEAMTILVGLLAEAAGAQPLAYHMGAALHAAEQRQPNAVRDRLLDEAFRLVLLKAMRAAPDDPVLKDLHASVNARTPKH